MELQHLSRKLSAPLAAAARRLALRLEELGRVSDERGRLTRTFLSPAMERANQLVGGWMRGAGMTVREDGVGNLIGRTPAKARTFVLGSHLDTVRDAGRFDGALGVLLGIAAVEALGPELAAWPLGLEVVGFSEEEGVRFSSAYLGSKGYAGLLTAGDLRRADAEGVTVAEAIAERGPLRALQDRSGRRFRSAPPDRELLGYLEVHIEQGPVLEAAGRPLGIVTAIAGQTRGRADFTGRAGHAGTTPMRLRRDALAGAAEWIGAVEAYAAARSPLVATVGTVGVAPGAANVIPGTATLTLDLRHPRDAARARALAALLARGGEIARRRGLAFRWEKTQDDPAVACDPRLRRLLAGAAAPWSAPALASGAGHDAVIVSRLAPVAMLFVRSRGGLSHHPDEYTSPRDIACALQATCAFLRQLAAR